MGVAQSIYHESIMGPARQWHKEMREALLKFY